MVGVGPQSSRRACTPLACSSFTRSMDSCGASKRPVPLAMTKRVALSASRAAPSSPGRKRMGWPKKYSESTWPLIQRSMS